MHISLNNAYLTELRCIFSVWSGQYEDEYDLLDFAYYEGCCEPIMAIAAPYVMGKSLVKKFNFRWIMVAANNS